MGGIITDFRELVRPNYKGQWMQIMREMCNICLMSDFVGNSDGVPVKGAIFVEKVDQKLKCVMQGRKNKRIEYFLDLNVDVPELTMEILQDLKEKIIEKMCVERDIGFCSLPKQPVQDDLCRIFDILPKPQIRQRRVI
jgi:hypothetical protein